jgi:hypothetical protein
VVDLVQRLGVKPVDPLSSAPAWSPAAASSSPPSSAAAADATGFGAGLPFGLGRPPPSPLVSLERLPRSLSEGWGKFLGGVDFYATGTKLLGDDMNVKAIARLWTRRSGRFLSCYRAFVYCLLHACTLSLSLSL